MLIRLAESIQNERALGGPKTNAETSNRAVRHARLCRIDHQPRSTLGGLIKIGHLTLDPTGVCLEKTGIWEVTSAPRADLMSLPHTTGAARARRKNEVRSLSCEANSERLPPASKSGLCALEPHVGPRVGPH